MTLGQIIDHEERQVFDYLFSGMAITKTVSEQYINLEYEERNNIFFTDYKSLIYDVKYPIMEKRALEHGERLNIINGEDIIKRIFYNDKSIINKRPMF